MIALGLVVALVGAAIAAFLERTIGLIVGVIGILILLFAVLPTAAH